MCAASANIDNDRSDDDNHQTDQIAKQVQKNIVNSIDKLFLHYTRERRFQLCKQQIHKVREDIFKNTSIMYSRLIVGHRNRGHSR